MFNPHTSRRRRKKNQGRCHDQGNGRAHRRRPKRVFRVDLSFLPALQSEVMWPRSHVPQREGPFLGLLNAFNHRESVAKDGDVCRAKTTSLRHYTGFSDRDVRGLRLKSPIRLVGDPQVPQRDTRRE
ncbi:hypothetical protein GQ600_193 [Phytophthora cactorum]|nr:hypothetical protein GQ600_193 [Phytophthora cactorum]